MDGKKILFFIAITFGISWLVALGLYLLDIEYGSLIFMGAVGVLYMPAPAYASLIIKGFYKQKLAAYGMEVRFLSLPWYLWSILGVTGLIAGSLLLVAILGNLGGVEAFGELQFTKEGLLNRMRELAEGKVNAEDVSLPMSPGLLLLVALGAGLLAGTTVNLPFALGEELGWRGLMVHETRTMGFFKANLLIGLIWGVWHFPIIFMGHNYPGYPYWGMAMMMAFTVPTSFVMTYLRFKIRSVLGPAAFHGMINGTANLGTLYIAGANPLFGSVAGLAGIIVMVGYSISIFVFDQRFIKNYTRRIQ